MSQTREALLDAGYDAAVTGPWNKVRMADVAAKAGVSRQTLYYEFGTKDQLAEAVAMREAQRFMAGADAARIGHEGSPAEAIAAAAEYTLTSAAGNRLLKAVLTDEASTLLPFITTRAESILTAARDHTAAYLRAQWPDLPTEEVALVAEVVNRLTISHLVLPSGRPDRVARDIAHLVDRLLPGRNPA